MQYFLLRIYVRINCSLLKAWIVTGIPFNVIENHSLWNNYYNITTPERKEYLVALSNYSTESRTEKFLTSKISAIIEKIGVNKFAAVVTDSAFNCHVDYKHGVKLDRAHHIQQQTQFYVVLCLTGCYISTSNLYAIQVFNYIILNFNILLTFYVIVFILTYYKALGVNDDGFRNAAIAATTPWQNLGYPEEQCKKTSQSI
ncbi:ribonuclease H-like domain-containing protein [Rhizophagus irregularis DAOM 181602=DAOM 197198]|nr:ribonuclease H-like domain-containing protein [Rhizophagus irregularis DAOM 181602=DAOM 197198]